VKRGLYKTKYGHFFYRLSEDWDYSWWEGRGWEPCPYELNPDCHPVPSNALEFLLATGTELMPPDEPKPYIRQVGDPSII
jgi:hypothetical protein